MGVGETSTRLHLKVNSDNLFPNVLKRKNSAKYTELRSKLGIEAKNIHSCFKIVNT